MHRVSQEEMEWVKSGSPGGMPPYMPRTTKFESYTKDVSGKMKPSSGPVSDRGNYPFEVSLLKVPPGKIAWPHHRHELQWEYYTVLSGSGVMRADNDEEVPVRPGDALMFPPGEAHTIINSGSEDLIIQIIADNPPAGLVFYPDSNKWPFYPPYKRFRMTEVSNYYDGEE